MPKILPPPKGIDAATQAARDVTLRSRFTGRDDPAPEPAPAARRRRVEPAGMTRRTYYLTTGTAEQLEDTLRRLEQASGGMYPRHELMAALVAAAAGQVDDLVVRLREQAMARLAGADTGAAERSHTSSA